MTTRNKSLTILLLIVLMTIGATSSLAGDKAYSRQGFYLGINCGGAASGIGFTQNDVERTLEERTGDMSMFRAGYGINENFLIGIQTGGFERDKDGEKLDFSTLAVTATWHPGGSGFFIRMGVGGGRADTIFDLDGRHYEFEEYGVSGIFGIGLEEWLTKNWCLGLSLDAQGIGFDEFDDLTETGIGFGGATIQMSWYL